ncbi:MAG: 2OG-Fe(II) oxygenase [Acidimicrobiales bacterium]
MAVRCNPRSRFYRYGLGGDFAPHQDEPWRPNESIISLLTVLVYLPAGGCQGGETVIDGEVVQVRDWRVAMFDHRLRHEGKPVEVGEKLVLRNDIVAHVVTICG